MSNVLAGIGRGKLKVLEEHVAARRRNFSYYEKHLGDLPGIAFQPEAEWVDCFVTPLLAMTNRIVIASPTGRRARRSMPPLLQLHRFREPEENNCARLIEAKAAWIASRSAPRNDK